MKSLARLRHLREKYSDEYNYQLGKIKQHSEKNDNISEVGLNIALKEARDIRCLLRVLDDTIKGIGEGVS